MTRTAGGLPRRCAKAGCPVVILAPRILCPPHRRTVNVLTAPEATDLDQCVAEMLAATLVLDDVTRYRLTRAYAEQQEAPHSPLLAALRELLGRPSQTTGNGVRMAALALDDAVRHAAARAFGIGAEHATDLRRWLHAVGMVCSAAARSAMTTEQHVASELNPVQVLAVDTPGMAA